MQHAVMAEHLGLDFLRVADVERAAARHQLPAVADLAARLGVERRAVEHDHRAVAGLDLHGCTAVPSRYIATICRSSVSVS